MDSIRYHLDHDVNYNTTIAAALRLRGIDVTVSWDVGLAHVSDEDQLTYTRRVGRVLVTHDADLLNLGRVPDYAGIVHYRQTELSIGDAIRGLTFIWQCWTPEEMTGSIVFLNRQLIEGL